mmetsp:Transcript_13540/g.29082  ORF Transcript_13540/g.29082 Transcript_13540/m.29082 type:complete len:1875 (-) Transcript_13540:137-5761(-)
MIRSSKTNSDGGAPQDPPQHDYNERAESATATHSQPSHQSSTQKSPSSNNIKRNNLTPISSNSDTDEDLAKTPLCICPSCDKVLSSMKSLYGHYGRSHRSSVNQDLIKYACPFCADDGVIEFEVFDTTSKLESHIDKSHPECTLLSSFTDTSRHTCAIASKSKIAVEPSPQKPSSQPQPNASPSTASASRAERRRSSRKQADDNTPSSSGKMDAKAPKQNFKHPLCKCPQCTRILPPQGLFGHFGRVHSGQLGGETARFEWKDVDYACPFCPKDLMGKDSPPVIFRTIELIEAHVSANHPHCHLTRPNALNKSRSSSNAARQSPKPDAVGSSLSGTRKSQRSRRSSANDEPEAEEKDDGNESTASSPAGSTRKSQRSRRPMHNGPMIEHIKSRGGGVGTAAAASKQQKAIVEDDNKTLYDCPDCDKKGLTKHGLHAHYGMVHGGRVDMDRCVVVSPKVKSKPKVTAAATSRTGPWTEEEHAAFLEGHNRYGNRWKQISVEYVPTRDAKQIGSHALNYFTTRGEWKAIGRNHRGGGSYVAGGSKQARHLDGSVTSPNGDNEDKRRSKNENSVKMLSHSLIGNNVVISTTPMDEDVDKEGDGESVDASVGSKPNSGVKDVENGKEEATTGSGTSDGDDGNSSHCIVCFEGGNIVCCSNCPRAYHPKCLAKDGHGNINVDLLPSDWRCQRCKKDFEISSAEEISQKYAFGNKKIRAAYSEFKDCSDYNYCCALLSNILDILNKLKNYDYGYVFSEPVDVDDVPDYPDVVRTPMDYGTISERLEGGSYVDLIASDDASRDDENSTMEDIMLHVLCDIGRVHHNCLLYNKQGSSIFRIGGVHASKWNAYFSQYIVERLPENVQRDLTLFHHRCELELQNGSHAERKLKAEKMKAKKREKAKATTPSKSPSATSKKRRASQPPDEKDAEDGMDDGDIDEEQRKPKAKRAKQEENPSHSLALLLTEEQMRSLENVFFSSATKLREEFDELDACSTLTALLDPSPANRKDSDKTGNLDALGGLGVSIGVCGGGAMTAVKSELSLHGLEQHCEVLPSNTAATTVAMVPELITSAPNIEQPPALANASSCSALTNGVNIIDMEKVSTHTNNFTAAQSKGDGKGTTFQRQWYERLNELIKYKIVHGTAVVSATSNDKLYHWRLRQRKRYHLTLFRMPHLKKDSPAWNEHGVDKNGKQWLLALPEMKGVFSLSASLNEGDGIDTLAKPFTIKDKDVGIDEMMIDAIYKKHQEQLYCPLPLSYSLASQHSSRHSNSLFWDESLEELRFFHGEHQHTLVPRDFPHNPYLPIWVELQRAKYLLQSIGIFSGLMGWQMLVLGDELNLCDLSSLPSVDTILANSDALDSGVSKTSQKGSGNKKGGKNKTKEESNLPERKTWSTHVNDFKEWFQKLSPEDKPKASELLPRANWSLYSWCWRQCNASSAILCMTPNVGGINMSVKKLNILASANFFHAFPYNDRNAGLVCEDDYESCEAFDSTFRVLENFSIKYGTTHIPDWYDCDRAFRMWVSALMNGLSNFVKGEPCVLSTRQIEQLILIGFCNDRPGLPNLSKGDVVWLKMFVEFKRHQGLFGVCSVSSEFPILSRWIAEQKELFRLSRMGNKDMMNSSRLQMLMEAGVDFFTGECLPGTANLVQTDIKEFELLTSSPSETFPAKDGTQNSHTNYGWNLQYDNYWNDLDCRARFEQMKAKNGHSIVLASDGSDVYWWFVEKRGKMLLDELYDLKSSNCSESHGFHSHSVLNFITAQREGDGTGSVGYTAEVTQSMFLWLHYCERLIMFKARKGHCKVPPGYPDRPLQRWLARQQELIYLYSTNQPTELLPVQLKILHALGVHGNKRYGTPPKFSSRTLKRKYPSKKDKKREATVKIENTD